MLTDARPPQTGPHRRILLHVDDSDRWHAAAALVGAYARATGAHVTVLSALLLPGNRGKALDQARRLLDLPEGRVEPLGRPGLIEYVLPDAARKSDADLVVVGRLGSADRLTSGLIAHLLVKRTPASVLVARGKGQAVRKVLVCTEGARHGLVNFERAVEIARAFDADLRVLHVRSQMALTQQRQPDLEEETRTFLAGPSPEAAHLRELEARIASEGLRGGVEVRHGLVVDEILDALHEGGHDLLVLGAHEVKGEGGLLYEDLAGNILRSSHVSTLVVRGPKGGPDYPDP
jgi:nucleotide-binding universal stress UspA family protein